MLTLIYFAVCTVLTLTLIVGSVRDGGLMNVEVLGFSIPFWPIMAFVGILYSLGLMVVAIPRKMKRVSKWVNRTFFAVI